LHPREEILREENTVYLGSHSVFLLQVQPNPENSICSKYIHCSVCYALAAGFNVQLRRKSPIIARIFLASPLS
jgi:hypothetical protein